METEWVKAVEYTPPEKAKYYAYLTPDELGLNK